MPILVVLVGVFFPRIVLFFAWLFAPGPLEQALGGSFLWLLLGFLFLPLTTLVYAFAYDPAIGSVQGAGLVVVVLAVLVDLGLIGGSARRRR